eukprot:sb/3463964/
MKQHRAALRRCTTRRQIYILRSESGPDQNWTSLLYVVEISFLSILRFCRSKSTHPSLRYVCYVGRIPAGSIFIKQDRNNPCVLLTHSLNLQYCGLYCPASVYGHVNLNPYIQNILKANLYYLQQTCPILIRSTLTLTHAKDDGLKNILRSPTKTLELYKKFKGEQHLQFSSTEEGMRFRLFKLNAHFVASENDVEGDTAHFALNMFSTMAEAEKESYLGLNVTGHANEERAGEDLLAKRVSVPTEKLWTNEGKVTPVKNQGSCGSCWTYAAVGGLETRYASKAGVLRNFAEQEYLDCVYEGRRNGCNGGWTNDCFDYSVTHGRLAPTSSYSYTASDGSCKGSQKSNGLVAAKITDKIYVGISESQNIEALAEGSLSMAFEVTTRFQSYDSGILSDNTCTGQANHAVTGVGYTSTYILVKNSWGGNWGHYGFVKFARGYPSACKLFHHSSYPTLTSTGVQDSGSDAATNYPEPSCENLASEEMCKEYDDLYNYCKDDWFWQDFCKKYCNK